MTLNVNSIVRVSASITPQGLLRREFGIPLFLTTDTTLPAGAGRVGVYAQFSDASSVFPVDSAPYDAAQVYFQQSPFPRNLIVARWINADVPALLEGGAVAPLASIDVISDGSLQIKGEDFTGLDFTGDTSYADVAATLQTALRAGTDTDLDNAVVAFDALSQTFSVSTGTGVGVDFTLTVASPAGSGTNVADLLGLSATAGGAVVQQGTDAETVEEALQNIAALNNDWYFITLEAALNDTSTVTDVSAWAAAGDYMFSAESNAAGVLVTGETGSIFAGLSALQSERTFGTWSATADYKALSIAGRYSSVNFSGRNSIITGKFKTLPGTLSDNITPTQKTELDRKQINHYSPFSGDNIYAEGITFAPSVFVDVRYALDWFVDAVRVAVYNLLRQSPTRVPQTNEGLAQLFNSIDSVCQAFVLNGGIAPGQLSDALTSDVINTTGNNEFDGFLTKGYLIYVNPLSEQSQSDRNQRLAPPVRIWLKGSGAIHFVDININFEN